MMHTIQKTLLILFIIYTNHLHTKLLIITHNYNQPSFIALQYKAFKKFLRNEFDYVVFNDATDPLLAEQIHDSCKKIAIPCYRVPQENRTSPYVKLNLNKGHFWAAARHGQAIQYSLDTCGFRHPGLVMIIDSDMFLIKTFDAEKLIDGYDIAGLRQVRDNTITYLWGGLLIFNMNNLQDKEKISFSNGLINGTYVDSCGFLHYYLKDHPRLKILYFEQNYRHFLDNSLKSYMIPSYYNGNNFKNWPRYMRCQDCTQKNQACSHRTKILQELNFSELIIEYVANQKMPPKIEFVLKDTFLHYQDGTNYAQATAEFLSHKNELFFNFICTLF